MNRLERLFAITEVIRQSGRQPISAARLAERFEVSRRTIERDLSSLREAGAPLRSEPGRAGGVVGLDAAAGVVVALSSTQVTALLMAVATAGSDMPYALDAKAGADLLLDGLAANTRSTVEELRKRIRNPHQMPQVSSRIRRTVETAVARGVVVNMIYRDRTGETTERSVEAIGFYLGQDGWHLNGWCLLRESGRIFRLDRIQKVNLTKKRNEKRDADEVLGWVPQDLVSP